MAKPLSADDQRQPFAMGPGSLFATLTHCYGAEALWLETIEGRDGSAVFASASQIQSLDELASRWSELDARWDRLLSGLTAADLAKPVTRVREGKAYTTSLGDVLIHVCTHQMYHAAQLKNMAKQLGVKDLPFSDYIVYAREQWKG